ncbi:MAG: GFA family protein [Gammaproteobacteria bacterium]
MQINQGGCLCSTIRFRISGEPAFSSICHCATCRRAGGAPTVAWLTFDRAQVEFLSGSPRVYRSSQGVVRQFCGTCGSQLSYESAASSTTIDITTASMDNPNLFPPTLEVWLEHRVSWGTGDESRTLYPRSARWPDN